MIDCVCSNRRHRPSQSKRASDASEHTGVARVEARCYRNRHMNGKQVSLTYYTPRLKGNKMRNALSREEVRKSFWPWVHTIPGVSADADMEFDFQLWSPDSVVAVEFKCSEERIKVVSRAWALIRTYRRLKLLDPGGGLNMDAVYAAREAILDLPLLDDLESEPRWGLERYGYSDRPLFIYEVVDPTMLVSGEERQLKYEHRVSEYLSLNGIDLITAEYMVRALEAYRGIDRIFEWANRR